MTPDWRQVKNGKLHESTHDLGGLRALSVLLFCLLILTQLPVELLTVGLGRWVSPLMSVLSSSLLGLAFLVALCFSSERTTSRRRQPSQSSSSVSS